MLSRVGVSDSVISLMWLVGPTSGIIMGPAVGRWSDHLHTRFDSGDVCCCERVKQVGSSQAANRGVYGTQCYRVCELCTLPSH